MIKVEEYGTINSITKIPKFIKLLIFWLHSVLHKSNISYFCENIQIER